MTYFAKYVGERVRLSNNFVFKRLYFGEKLSKIVKRLYFREKLSKHRHLKLEKRGAPLCTKTAAFGLVRALFWRMFGQSPETLS